MTLLQHAKNRLARAKKTLGQFRTQEAEGIIDSIDHLLSVTRQQAARLDADERLSAVGKRQQKAELQEALRSGVKERLDRLDQIVANNEQRYRQKLTLPPLDGEDAQGRLANARADAVMVLDRTPDDRLHEAMETLARDPGDVGTLMLTGFAERYLQARPSNATAAMWNAKKDGLLVERLGEPAREAQAALAGLADVRAAHVMAMHQAHREAEELGPSMTTDEA